MLSSKTSLLICDETPTNANYATDFQLSYLAAGDSELIKGSSLADGSEMVNLAGIGSDVLSPGINNFSEFIGQNISGTAWIADGGYANIRLKLNTTAPAAAYSARQPNNRTRNHRLYRAGLHIWNNCTINLGELRRRSSYLHC